MPFVQQYVIGTGHMVQREISDEYADDLAGSNLPVSDTPFPGVRMWDDEMHEQKLREYLAWLVSRMSAYEHKQLVMYVRDLKNMAHDAG